MIIMKTFWKIVTNLILLGLALIILPAIIVFIARESLQWQGVRTVRKDLQALSRLSTAKNCEEEYGLVMAQGEQMYRQLRFTSSRAYVLELICPGFPDRPLVSEQRVLSSFMSKIPGSAGIIQRTDIAESYIGIAVFQELVKGLPEKLKPWLSWISRGELIGLSAGEIVIKPLAKNPTLTATSLFGEGPISTCEGYGFSCCNAQTQYGMGDMVNNVPTCPANCYARCSSRPLVVSWRSSPQADWGTNLITLPSGGSVEFFYVLEDGSASGPWSATIDFGDGQQMSVDGKEGTATHEYSCTTSTCEYTASVVAQNALGAESALTELAQLKVIVGTPAVDQATEPAIFAPTNGD